MPRYPGAIWEPLNVTAGRGSNGPFKAAPLGIVLHCNDAESLDLHDFELNNINNGPTSHFQVIKDGTVYQYIDTAMTSWCQTDGNNTYLSIESQGMATEQATPQQVAAIGGILAWALKTHGIPLQIADVPGQRGFGWHGMGAAAGQNWGHAVCPGVRKDQRAAMIAAAKPAPAIQEDDMQLNETFVNDYLKSPTSPGPTTNVQEALAAGQAAYNKCVELERDIATLTATLNNVAAKVGAKVGS